MLNKTLTTLTIIIFFGLGSLSVALAARAPSAAGLPQYVKYHGSHHDGVPQMDSKTLKTGTLIEEDGELPDLSKDQSEISESAKLPFYNCRIIAASRILLAPKISTCIFQSVLNL